MSGVAGFRPTFVLDKLCYCLDMNSCCLRLPHSVFLPMSLFPLLTIICLKVFTEIQVKEHLCVKRSLISLFLGSPYPIDLAFWYVITHGLVSFNYFPLECHTS